MMLSISGRIALTKNIYHFFSRCVCQVQLTRKSKINMEKAYFRHTDGEEHFHLSFVFSNDNKTPQRQFNLARRKDETVGSVLARISNNIDKFVNKKQKKNKKEVHIEEKTDIQIKLTQDGKEIPNDDICLDVVKTNIITNLHIMDSKLEIVINSPWIITMTLPNSILAGFPLYPIKFEGQYLEKDKSIYHWYSATSKIVNTKWEKVGEGFVYYPTLCEIGKYIKLICIPGNTKTMGPEMETISTKVVEVGPGWCPFENRHLFTQTRLAGDMLRIVSYNILADLYCDSDYAKLHLFPYCPPYALQMDYRKQLFLKEILGYNGDIVCLQEVDIKIFNFDLIPLMEANSYEGLFCKKGKETAEGVACFYRSDRFKFIVGKSCILGEQLRTPLCKDIWDLIKHNEPFIKRFEDRTTAVQANALQSLDNPNEIIVVGNTHFYFHPDADNVRLMQGGVTILWLNNYVDELKLIHPDKRISLILCGDFNTTPDCGIFKLYTTGHVPEDHVDWRSNTNEAVKNVSLSQPTPLQSACGTPKYTNFTEGFADCLDYIFYNKNSFNVSQVIPLPTDEELSLHTALPSVVFPSDHIALVADLQIKT